MRGLNLSNTLILRKFYFISWIYRGEFVDFIGSKRAVDEGSAYVAGGVNSGYRTGLRPNPLVFTSAHGCRLTDIDGNELIDYFFEQ